MFSFSSFRFVLSNFPALIIKCIFNRMLIYLVFLAHSLFHSLMQLGTLFLITFFIANGNTQNHIQIVKILKTIYYRG